MEIFEERVAICDPGEDGGIVGQLQAATDGARELEEDALAEEARALEVLLERIRPMLARVCPPEDPALRPALMVIEEKTPGITRRLIVYDGTVGEEIIFEIPIMGARSWFKTIRREISAVEAVRNYGFKRIIECLDSQMRAHIALLGGKAAEYETRLLMAKRIREVK